MSVVSKSQIIDEMAAQFAPFNTVRAAINLGNRALAHRNEDDKLDGISVRLARELAGILGRDFVSVVYHSAGQVFADADKDKWDVAFLAIDLERRAKVTFSSAYLRLEGTYLVRDRDRVKSVTQIDIPGTRIAVAQNAAYDLYLTRELRHAEIVRVNSPEASVEVFKAGKADAVAGVRQTLAAYLPQVPGSVVVSDAFSIVEQAVCVPANRPVAAAYIEIAVNRLQAAGFFKDLEQAG